MNVQDAMALAAGAVAAHPTRPGTMVIHDSADARVVLFRIEPGQAVAVHTNPATVLLTVLSGRGFVSGRNGEQEVKEGDFAAYEPHEPHGMRADESQLLILAVIAPRPSSR